MKETGLEVSRVSVQIPVESSFLQGVLWQSDADPRASVVIHCATATPASFYSGFAAYLASNGYVVLTYDYRGIGRSGPAKRHRHMRMRDWLLVDAPTASRWIKDAFPHIPAFAVGHSLGGQALALNAAGDSAGFVMVASHAGISELIPQRAERLRVKLLLNHIGPALARVFGYVPAKRLGVGEDMPAAAMREWSTWSNLPHYFFDDPSMDALTRTQQVTCPVLVVGLSDDPWATPELIAWVTRLLSNAEVEKVIFTPQDAAVAAIGHHGFFRRKRAGALWPEILQWLNIRSNAE